MVLPLRPLALYERLPHPILSDAQLRAIVDRLLEQHSLNRGEHPDLEAADTDVGESTTRLASTGVVRSLWAIGSRAIVNVPKDEPMCLLDHATEAAAIPLARQAGARTPALLLHDTSATTTPWRPA